MSIKYINEPLQIITPVPNGNYEVSLTINAMSDTTFSVTVQNRRFVVMDQEIKRGEVKVFTFAVNVCDYHKSGEEYTECENLIIEILCDGDITAVSQISPAEIPTIYIAGDSTVTDQYPAAYPYDPSHTYCGWGQMLPMLLDEKIAVSNHAQSGSCTKEFMACNLLPFKDKIKKGDYLVVEFGHNDQKVAELDAFGGYKKNLEYFISLAREKGAIPILTSPINRIIFNPDGTLLNLLGEYRNAVCEVSTENNVTFIDLWSLTTDYWVKAGPVSAWDYFWSDGKGGRDYTHTNDIGGSIVARMWANSLSATGLEAAAHIKRDLLSIPDPVYIAADSAGNEAELEHIKNIGLVNVPEKLANLDKDLN